LELLEANQAAGYVQEGFVDVGATLVADAQPPILVQPGNRALDHPALATEPGAVWALWPGDLGSNAALA